jgi:transposase
VKEELVYLGIDIAKSYLDTAIGNEKRRFCNDTIGHRELIRWVKQVKAPVQVICESSGGYERALVQALARARIKISLVQAKRVRQFARAAGILTKTDRIDAEVLWEFGKATRPQRVTAARLEQEHLGELESHIDQSQELSAKAVKLTSISGVAERTAAFTPGAVAGIRTTQSSPGRSSGWSRTL